jgi:hypothetical protein
MRVNLIGLPLCVAFRFMVSLLSLLLEEKTVCKSSPCLNQKEKRMDFFRVFRSSIIFRVAL